MRYVTIYLTDAEVQRIEDIAERTQRSRNAVLRLLIQQAKVLKERDVALQPVAPRGAEARRA